jgi:hypothetical protein
MVFFIVFLWYGVLCNLLMFRSEYCITGPRASPQNVVHAGRDSIFVPHLFWIPLGRDYNFFSIFFITLAGIAKSTQGRI